MAIRLTEKEVHDACLEISAQGERPTSLALLNKLGRGSLTTITKHLNSWNDTEDAQSLNTELLPSVVELPEALSINGQELTKKIWAVAKGLADDELEIQRAALKQAETANQAKVEEAFQFSEAQTEKIEVLEESLKISEQKLESKTQEHGETVNKLNEAEKTNVGLTKDNEILTSELNLTRKELKLALKKASDAEKLVSNLEGKLEVYNLLGTKQGRK